MEEIWKDIDGYNGLYQISNYGRVKSLIKHNGTDERILKPIKNLNGYLQVNLSKKGKLNIYSIHRLVAQAFIPNDDLLKTEINHKDENKINNNVNNLEWVDHKSNMNYGTRNERSSKSQINNPKRSKQVNQYSLDGKTLIKTFPSIRQIGRETSFAPQNICNCCNGKVKQAYGFIWEYV